MSTDGMLAKGLRLLIALGEHPEGVGVSKLAREVNLPVSTTHRLLSNMVTFGFVSFDQESKSYKLGLKLFELSHKVALAKDLSDIALPVMRKLAESTGEAISLAVPDGKELVYVERVEGSNRIQIKGSVGARGPLHSTSQGKAILAFLPENEREELLRHLPLQPRTRNTIVTIDELLSDLEETRQRGYAISDEENEDGIHAVGVPIIDNRQRLPIAALSVVAPMYRVSRETLEHFALLLRDAAQEIRVQLP